MCYRKRNRSPQRKTSPLPSKQSIIHWRMKLGYMNIKKPFKPNLPSVPKPSKLLAPTRLHRTFVFSSKYLFHPWPWMNFVWILSDYTHSHQCKAYLLNLYKASPTFLSVKVKKKSQTPRPREITQWAMEKSKSKEKFELTKGIKQALPLVK